MLSFPSRPRRAFALTLLSVVAGCASNSYSSKGTPLSSDPKAQVVALLKSIETGEAAPVAVVNPAKYIQHTIVDTQTDKIEGEIAGFNKIRAISVTADGKTLFAANSGSNEASTTPASPADSRQAMMRPRCNSFWPRRAPQAWWITLTML